MQNTAIIIRYRVMALEGDGTLIVNVLGKDLCFKSKALSIIQNPEILKGFDTKSAAWIGYIAGTSYNI